MNRRMHPTGHCNLAMNLAYTPINDNDRVAAVEGWLLNEFSAAVERGLLNDLNPKQIPSGLRNAYEAVQVQRQLNQASVSPLSANSVFSNRAQNAHSNENANENIARPA